MHKVNLQSGTYAVDDALQGFDIIEKPSSNVAFVATCMITNKMYVQFKNGSGYMYSEVDLDTLSAVSAVDSIGKFINSQVVKKFPSEKLNHSLIMPAIDESEELTEEQKKDSYYAVDNQIAGRLTRNSQSSPITEITGFDEALKNAGKTLAVDRKAVVTHTEPGNNQEPEF